MEIQSNGPRFDIFQFQENFVSGDITSYSFGGENDEKGIIASKEDEALIILVTTYRSPTSLLALIKTKFDQE